MWYVYVLKSPSAKRTYVGYTADLRKRIDEHNSGHSFSTKPYRPWTLVFYAAIETEKLAERFERYLKSGSGHAFMRKRFVEPIWHY